VRCYSKENVFQRKGINKGLVITFKDIKNLFKIDSGPLLTFSSTQKLPTHPDMAIIPNTKFFELAVNPYG